MNKIVLFISLMMLVGGCNGSTWTKDMTAFNGGKDLPSLGLTPPTPGLKFSYVMKETGIPTSWDWRNTPNGTRVTPVKDQDGTPQCVAYAISAQEESAMEIAANSNKPLPDLAEDEFFSHGGGPNGWDFNHAYPVAKYPGIMTQKCYDTGTCKERAIIKGWSTTTTPKAALLKGPIVSGIGWDSLWDYYDSGVIDDYSGDIRGYHALCIIGYNDIDQYWIIKNSWGVTFGESGYLRMKYDVATAMGLGTDFSWYTVDMGAAPPGPGPTPTNKTWTAAALDRPTGNYTFGMKMPEIKSLMGTKAYSKPVPIGKYPADQKFIWTITTPKGTFSSDNKLYATTWTTSAGGYWIYFRGVNGIKYRNDAIIEIRRS